MFVQIEAWIKELFPGSESLYDQYKSLPPRELVTLVCGMLDVALAELLSKRLLGAGEEIASFHAPEENGDVPAATLGSRIQLARMGRIINDRDVAVLRALRNLRNVMVDRQDTDFLDPEVLAPVKSLHAAWLRVVEGPAAGLGANPQRLRELERCLSFVPEAAGALITGIFAAYDAHFHKLLDSAAAEGL